MSAIDFLIIDTQVARRGRQYHRNPPPYKKSSYKSNCPTKYKIRKFRKTIKQIEQKKNIDRKTACPKCRNPSRPTKNKTVLQKANRSTKYQIEVSKNHRKKIKQTNTVRKNRLSKELQSVLQKAKKPSYKKQPIYKMSNTS